MFIHFDRFDVTRGAVGCLCITIDVFNDPLVTDFGIVFPRIVDNCIVVTSTIVIVISKEAAAKEIAVKTSAAMIFFTFLTSSSIIHKNQACVQWITKSKEILRD